MKIIEVVADVGHVDTITGIAAQHATDYWLGPQNEDGRCSVRLLVAPEGRQAALDALQGALGTSDTARILVIPLEAALPRETTEDDDSSDKKPGLSTTREELYNAAARDTRLDGNFLLLVFLSTIVAAIGLIEDNVAVVIGAMVIAPLLGPNIALALGTALGDRELMWQAAKTTLVGLGFAMLIAIGLGVLWPFGFDSRELLARTDVGLDSVALALASGAAAVLSLTTGLPSVLVGVMVAVALLPPAATMGLMLGKGAMAAAGGAALLLAVNVVCVNLAAKLVLLLRGVKPRTWLEKKKAKQSMAVYLAFWLASLIVLVILIYARSLLISD